MPEEYQSAKVYVLDFHFKSNSKEDIAKKKEEMDAFFENIKRMLDETEKGTAIEQIFLRKH